MGYLLVSLALLPAFNPFLFLVFRFIVGYQEQFLPGYRRAVSFLPFLLTVLLYLNDAFSGYNFVKKADSPPENLIFPVFR